MAFRVTGYRPNDDAAVKIPGADLMHDLRLLVEDLSDSIDLPADAVGEQVVEEVVVGAHLAQKYPRPPIQSPPACNNRRPKIPDDMPEVQAELLRSCWDAQPEKRPTFMEIITQLQEL